MNKDGEGAVLFSNGFVDSIGELLLGAKTARSAESISPGESHGMYERSNTMLEGSMRTGVNEKFLSSCSKKGKKIIREVFRFILREESRVVNRVAGETMEVFVSETNIEAFDEGVLGVFHGVCWKRNV
jgi:hypothetical protein